MSKNKLAKFADMATYPHVVEAPGVATETTPFALRGRWKEDFFKNDHPIVLELGCGRGEYTVGLARIFPQKNFIGVDIKGARMWTGATDSIHEGLTNVGFLRTHIEFIQRFFAPDEVSEIWLTFSDPQMKKPSKRLSSSYFLNRYKEFLVDSGRIHLKTDSNFLFTYTRLLVEGNQLPVCGCTSDLYAEQTEPMNAELRQILHIQTYYEKQWIARGKTIKYISFLLPRNARLVEPEIEIELDDYRSFNRFSRSSLEKSK